MSCACFKILLFDRVDGGQEAVGKIIMLVQKQTMIQEFFEIGR